MPTSIRDEGPRFESAAEQTKPVKRDKEVRGSNKRHSWGKTGE